MESMSSKAISPRNEPVSGRWYILEVSVKNDCRWRRGWNWNWRIRNGEKIPTGGTRTATSHTSLYIHEKCAEVVIGKRIPWLTYPSRRTERDMLTHIPLTYTHPGDFFSCSSSSFHGLLYISLRIYIKIVLFRRKTCRRNIQTSSSRFKTA